MYVTLRSSTCFEALAHTFFETHKVFPGKRRIPTSNLTPTPPWKNTSEKVESPRRSIPPPLLLSSTLLIHRRTNCIITASGIVTFCKQPYSMQVDRSGVWGWQVGRPPQAPLLRGPRASGLRSSLWVCQAIFSGILEMLIHALFKKNPSSRSNYVV